jgi:hypothetical protein
VDNTVTTISKQYRFKSRILKDKTVGPRWLCCSLNCVLTFCFRNSQNHRRLCSTEDAIQKMCLVLKWRILKFWIWSPFAHSRDSVEQICVRNSSSSRNLQSDEMCQAEYLVHSPTYCNSTATSSQSYASASEFQAVNYRPILGLFSKYPCPSLNLLKVKYTPTR